MSIATTRRRRPSTIRENAEAEIARTPAAPVVPVVANPKPIWVKIERPAFDQVVKFGSDAFLAGDVDQLTPAQLERAKVWIADRFAEKKPGHFLVFPVSRPKQVSAGKLYFGSLSRFQQAVESRLGGSPAAAASDEDVFGKA